MAHSGDLKKIFEEQGLGKASDWKRVSKNKDGSGQWVREFENAATGAKIQVTETGNGKLKMVALNGGEKATPAQGAAADKIIRILMGEEDGDISKELVAQAGKALASRYCFALSAEGEELSVVTSPIRYFKMNSHCDDRTGPIVDLLPGLAETMESTWEIHAAVGKTPLEVARYMQQLGFQWNKDFQTFIDSSLTQELSQGLAATPSDTIALNKALAAILRGDDDVPASWIKEAGKALAGRFVFTVVSAEETEADDGSGKGYVAYVTPAGCGEDEEARKSYAVMKQLCPEARYVDECVGCCWSFPKSFDTPLKVAQKMVSLGFVWSEDNQSEYHDSLMGELKALKKPKAPKP